MTETRLDALKQKLFLAEERIAPIAEEISTSLWNHPELSDGEYASAKLLTEKAAAAGFRVTMPCAGLETAFLAEYGDPEGPTVAFLAEYDALPGYGELSPNGTGNAHACGHNWIAASTFAAAAAVKEVLEAEKAADPSVRGRVLFIGTPAEETWGGKIKMAEEGVFNGIDAVFQCHLWNMKGHCVENCALGEIALTYTFDGKASHAPLHPENGINALDACNLTFAGINALRQQLCPDVRIHGFIREGGTACNVIPDHCVMELYVRAANRDYMEEVAERVNNCARGGALMTGCKLSIYREPWTYYDLRNTHVLSEKVRENMKRYFELTDADFREDTIYHAASTDIGNVSYYAPTFYGEISMDEVTKAGPHEIEFLKYTDSDYAHRMLHFAARSTGASALDILFDEAFRNEVAEAFRKL